MVIDGYRLPERTLSSLLRSNALQVAIFFFRYDFSLMNFADTHYEWVDVNEETMKKKQLYYQTEQLAQKFFFYFCHHTGDVLRRKEHRYNFI